MLGIDIVSVPRIRNFVGKFGVRGLGRFLSRNELALCQKSQVLNYARVAGFWAAKEALSKAFGCGIGRELGFLDINLHLDSKGAPHISLCAERLEYFRVQKTFSQIALSITHEREFAIACVVLH